MTMQQRHGNVGEAFVNCDGIPAAIVAVENGEPLVLLVSGETLEAFNEVKEQLGLTHVELANQLRERICRNGGQFHENSVAPLLGHIRLRG